MNRRRGLGSGLDALLQSTPAQTVRDVAIEAIRPNRSQPRNYFDDQALSELAASVREHGVIQPLVVSADSDGSYELIAGERRLRAAKLAGLRNVPVILKEATPQQLLELALVENIQRADLNPLEEARAYQALKDEFGLSDESIAQRVGKSRTAVANSRRLLRLIPAAADALVSGQISAGHGRALLRLEVAGDQAALLGLLVERELNVRDAERIAELAQSPLISTPVRAALLDGRVQPAQAQALLRVDDPEHQQAALTSVLTNALNVRETEQLCDRLAEGVELDLALHSIRPGRSHSNPEQETGEPRRAERAPLNPDDEAMRRMFEDLLATPVYVQRSGTTVKLTLTFYSDEQLQAFYDTLNGDN